MAVKGGRSDRDVFVNCPFDDEYVPLLEALMFAIHACEFRVRCALEIQDSGDLRLLKILKIIRESPFGIHELSRMELDPKSQLPRFNMPFELGLYLAAKHFGAGSQKRKQCLVLDAEPYRYQKCLSDIAGQDIQAHANEPRLIIRRVRDWLSSCGSQPALPSGGAIFKDYEQFQAELPQLLQEQQLLANELTFLDRARLVAAWLADRAKHGELHE